jgi:hypothetical protein
LTKREWYNNINEQECILENNNYATIKEIVEYGLEKIPDEQKITVNLKDFMYICRVLDEYMRYFHNLDHYKKIEDVKEFLGDFSSAEFSNSYILS